MRILERVDMVQDNFDTQFDVGALSENAVAGESGRRVTPHHRGVIIAIKAIIVFIALLVLACQIFLLPYLAHEAALDAPEYAGLRVPYLVLSIAVLCCLEVVLVALWRLLSMTDEGHVFNVQAFRWVDVIIWAAVVAAILTAVLLVYSLAVGLGPFGFLLVLFVAVMAEIGFALLVSVMRSLLVVATSQHDELEAVI